MYKRRAGAAKHEFEEAVHGFAECLNVADTPSVVEAALLRFVRRILPASRVELIRPEDEAKDPLDHHPSNEESCDRGGTGRPIRDWARRCDESVYELSLRNGGAVVGRLRLFGSARGRCAVTTDALRKLSTACTMAACALENLRLRAECPWPSSEVTDDDDRRLGASLEPVIRIPADPPAPVVRDATFLNAVLPFALSQARRHRESLSLLCVGVDRLGAIQSLLGPEVADRLVHHVGRTVAAMVRSSDIVARLDDDRVVALLVRAPGPDALNVAQVICRTVAETTSTVMELPGSSVSIGVAEFPSNAWNVFTLLDAADDALTHAQSRGRNQAVLAVSRPAPRSYHKAPDRIAAVGCP